jgi:hypothetical protein
VRFLGMTLLVAAALAAAPLPGPGRSAPVTVQDPLDQLNAAFRDAYAKARQESLARGGPVLMVSGDELVLYRHNVRLAGEVVRPAGYHRLKAVAHVALALHLVLGAQGGQTPDGAALRAIRALALAARDDLKHWASPADLPRQERILDGCLQLLDDQLKPDGLAPGRLAAFGAAMGPLVLANADTAAALELEALHRAVARFRKGMDAGDWTALRVVIIGSHMAREGEVASQYFARLLGEPGEGERIIFAESLWQPKDALDLLATHRVDLGAGAAFFGEPMRMHRDILADGARKWLDAHLPLARVTEKSQTMN